MLKSRGGTMESPDSDQEVAELIVVELTNEHKFVKYIKLKLKRYFNDELTFIQLCGCVRGAQSHHHRIDNHTHYLRKMGKDMKHRVTVRLIEYYWEEFNTSVFNRWDIPEEARYLYEIPEKPEVVNINMAELEIRVLAKYGNLLNQATQKAEHLFERSKSIDEIIEYFQMYKQGRWAWNTLRKKLDEYLHIAWDDNQDDLCNLFALKIYQKIFKNELYQRDFTSGDIPPQCFYLLTNEKVIEHDDHVDALSYQITGHLNKAAKHFETCERKLEHIFKPKEDSTMLNIKNVTLINGQDASELDNDQIFAMIANTEKQIKKLQEIEAKPKALEAKIKALKESIENLVKIVDSRD